jgi:dihydroxyacid dehydratase/phosphogluconate dehydratase
MTLLFLFLRKYSFPPLPLVRARGGSLYRLTRDRSCDKNMPACMIAAARYNRPTILIYGGSIKAGTRHLDCPALGQKKGDPINIGSFYESYGGYLSGDVPRDQHDDVVKHACPGVGSCGGESA